MSKTNGIVLLVAAALAVGCGEKKEKPPEPKGTAEQLEAEARDKAADVKTKAAGLLDRAADLKDKAEAAKGELEAAKGVAMAKVFDAAATALRAKGEFDKVYKSTGDYDLEVSAEGFDDAGMKAHQEKIAAMPHVTVGDVTVGYEEMDQKALNGTTFTRHFRATWTYAGMKIGLSYYTKEQIDLPAFAQLLGKLVPVVQAAL